MKILYVTSEALPYATTGGLGDVMGALPKAIHEEGENIETAVILPMHRGVKSSFFTEMEHICDVSFKLSWRDAGAAVYHIRHNEVDYFFIENEYYFDRQGLYGEYDDAERYAFFSLSVIEFIKEYGLYFDILHANDWQTAMSIVYLKRECKTNINLRNIKTAFTIHNIEHQGKFNPYILGDVFGLDNEYIPLMCDGGCINLLRAAMLSTDRIITVSPNYANEIKYDFFSYGLSETVKKTEDKTVGIINGIDYNIFSPSAPDIAYRYTKRTVRFGKSKNKADTVSKLSLPYGMERPLITMISRLTEQKGIDLLSHVIDELLREDINLIILGSGEERYETILQEKTAWYDNLRVILGFNRPLSKQLYASADIFLMPSKTEPCGIAQMIACSYGAVPIVRNTGGLTDTIIPFDLKGANGFRFDNYNAHDFLFTVKRACAIYRDNEKWSEIRRNCVNADFSWKKSAIKYINVYNELTNE